MMRSFRYALIALVFAVGVAHAHPWGGDANHRDRSMGVIVREDKIVIDYWLLLSPNIIAEEARRDPATYGTHRSVADLYFAYRRVWAKRIAEAFVATLDGKPLTFAPAETLTGPAVHEKDDHVIFLCRFEAAVSPDPDRAKHELRIEDTCLRGVLGTYRLALRAEGRVEVVYSNAAAKTIDDRTHKVILSDREDSRSDRLHRTLEADFTIGGAEQPAVPDATAASVDADASFWSNFSAAGIRRHLDSPWGLGLVLVFAFAFGMIHAFQPGHGKTLVAAYLVGERGTVGHALYLGLITTLTHTSMVIVLAIAVPYFFPDHPEAQQEIQFGLALACGLIVVMMAIWLLLRRLAGQADHVHLFGGHHHHHDHAHGDNHSHPHSHDGHSHTHSHEPPGRVRWWALTSLGVTGGLVPCIDAIGILLLAYVIHRPTLGLGLVLSFSLGLASVLVALGIAVVKFRRFAVSRWGNGGIVRALPIVSALATLLLGIWMIQYAFSVRGA